MAPHVEVNRGVRGAALSDPGVRDQAGPSSAAPTFIRGVDCVRGVEACIGVAEAA